MLAEGIVMLIESEGFQGGSNRLLGIGHDASPSILEQGVTRGQERRLAEMPFNQRLRTPGGHQLHDKVDMKQGFKTDPGK